MIVGGKKKPGGYATWTNGDGPNIERDSVTCKHCGCVVFIEPLKPVEDFTGWCMACFGFVCLTCAASGNCVPLERRLEMMERG